MKVMNGSSVVDWYARNRSEYCLDVRNFGQLKMLEAFQPGGEYKGPATDEFVLNVPLFSADRCSVVQGCGAQSGDFVPGQLVLEPANSTTIYRADGDHHVIAIAADRNTVCGLLEEATANRAVDFGMLHSSAWNNREVQALCLSIWRAARGAKRARQLDAATALAQLVLHLARSADLNLQDEHARHALDEFRCRRVVAYVEENLAEGCDLFSLANVGGLSPYHFARSFSRAVGISPHAYVLSRRIARAKLLITKSNTSIADISYACGFSSQQHMITVFTQYEGTTPARLRADKPVIERARRIASRSDLA
jgi:AraC family transcriptional regulator